MNVLSFYSIINSNCKEYYVCLPCLTVISILSTSYKSLKTLDAVF